MHQNLKDAIEKYKQEKLPEPPEVRCGRCGNLMKPSPVKYGFPYEAYFDDEGGFRAQFSVKYDCSTSWKCSFYGRSKTFDTDYPRLEWE